MQRGKRPVHWMESAWEAGGCFGWARAVKRGHGSGPDDRKAPPPHFLLDLREKLRLNRSADRYRVLLDGKTRPDHVGRTVAGSLRVGIGDALVYFATKKSTSYPNRAIH